MLSHGLEANKPGDAQKAYDIIDAMQKAHREQAQKK
jgi:hypothetical protein